MRGLNTLYTQEHVTKALHTLLGGNNISTIHYNRAQADELGRHDGIATVCCTNTGAYTTWCSRRAIPLLGKLVDFTPHHRSINGDAPLEHTRAYDNRPTREILNDAIVALKNETPKGPSLQQIQKSMQDGVDSLQLRLHSLSTEVNIHTSLTIDAAASAQQQQHQHLLEQLRLLTTASSDYSRHMSGISHALLSDPMQQAPPRPPGFNSHNTHD